MRSATAASAFLVLALGAWPLAAQQTSEIRPGDPRVDGSRIVPHADTTRLSMIQDGKERLGPIQIEELARVSEPEGDLLRQVMRIEGGRVALTDTTWFRASDLMPIRHRSHGQGTRTLELDYPSGPARGRAAFGRVQGRVTPAEGEATQVDVALEQPIFDPGASHLLLQALPLAQGLHVRVPFFDHTALDEVWFEFRVVAAEERPREGAAPVPVWRVEQTLDTGRMITLWVDRASGRVVEVHTVVQPGLEMRGVGG